MKLQIFHIGTGPLGPRPQPVSVARVVGGLGFDLDPHISWSSLTSRETELDYMWGRCRAQEFVPKITVAQWDELGLCLLACVRACVRGNCKTTELEKG